MVEKPALLMEEATEAAKYILTDDESERARLKDILDSKPESSHHKLVGIQTLENLLE